MDKQYFKNSDQQNFQDLENVNFGLNSLLPENLCPFAAHALYPYYYSFKQGSWFRWMKDKNSVIAQCPNPESCVTFKITRNPGGEITAEVINKKVECLAGHQVGEVFQLAAAVRPAIKWNCCNLNQVKNLSVSVVNHCRACRYYQKPGQVVAKETFVPKGFCLPAFFKTYPAALSLLYDGWRFDKDGQENLINMPCPNNEASVKIQVRTQRNVLTPLMNLIEKTLRFFGWPKDALDKAIKIDTMAVTGNCPQNLKPGQIFNFNLYSRSELCPAVFYNLFPFWVMLNERVFPYWAVENRHIDIHCPDAMAKIIYRISVKKT